MGNIQKYKIVPFYFFSFSLMLTFIRLVVMVILSVLSVATIYTIGAYDISTLPYVIFAVNLVFFSLIVVLFIPTHNEQEPIEIHEYPDFNPRTKKPYALSRETRNKIRKKALIREKNKRIQKSKEENKKCTK